jgi:class 3 adenylate cyclase/tetratricopeptide (TPR) repeat protein
MSCANPLAEAHAFGPARKTVTIVFCDVVGSTPIGDDRDPEAIRRVMTRFFDEMRVVLERHGGTVEKYIGDAVMAVFGIPTLHEDDALRAVRAAADMRSALMPMNADFERTAGVSIVTRTGVNTGEVSVSGSPVGPAVMGDAVNVAARLQQAATPGDILLGHETYQLVRDFVAVDDAVSLVLKGKSVPVTAHPLLELTHGIAELPRRPESRLVGRTVELDRIRRAFERTVRERSCLLMTVVGAAGAGKSRLARESVKSIGDAAVAVVGRCLPYGEGITFSPMADVVRQLAEIDVDDPLQTARSKLDALLVGAEDSVLLFDRVAAATGLADAAAGMQETFWAIRRLLEWVGRDRPLVVIFDDLQWSEPAFLDLLDYVQRSSRGAPILVLCLARNDLLEERPDWAAEQPNAILHLSPLEDREMSSLIDDLLQGDNLQGEMRDRIIEVCGGNPLFVEEMLQMLRDDDELEDSRAPATRWSPGGRWVAGRPPRVANLTVPPTIYALVGARLDRLTVEERAVIRAASVIGKLFWWGAVMDLVPADTRQDVGPILQRLVRRELIAPDRSALVGEDAFRFHHLLIQEAAYRETPKEVRADLHARFATWLERTAGDRIGENEEILAYHQEQAARYLIELGRSDAEIESQIDRASKSLASVGRRAFLARGDMSAAANLLGRAHDVLPPGDQRRLAIVPELGQALTEIGEMTRAEQLLTDAVERANATGDRGLEAHARIVLLLLKLSTDPQHRLEEALQVLEDAIPVLEEMGDDLGLARAFRLRGDVHWTRSVYAEADRAFEQAMIHARRAGASWEEAECLRQYAGSGLYGPAPVAEVVKRCDRIIELAKGNPTAEAGAIRSLGVLNAMQGRIDEGRELVRESAKILEDLGLKMRAVFVSEAAAFIEMLAGDHAAAERVLRVGYEETSGLDLGYQSTAAALVAHPICAQGRLEEAEEFCRIAKEIGAEDDLATQVLWRSAKAKVLAARGELRPALELARDAVAIAERTDDINMHADTLMDLGTVLSATGALDEHDEAVRRAHELYVRKGNVVSAALAERLIAERI